MLSIISAVLAVAVALASPLAPAVGGVEWPGSVQEQNQNEPKPVDVNTATAEELQSVPGIGETLAKRIVEFREEHGPFEKVDDLLNVRGIGVASLDRMLNWMNEADTGAGTESASSAAPATRSERNPHALRPGPALVRVFVTCRSSSRNPIGTPDPCAASCSWG